VSVSYAELHCHSNYSFLDGTSDPEDLVEQAHKLGLRAIALTDHDGIYGLVRFADHARKLGMHAIVGAEVTLVDGAHLVLLVRNLTGYRNLSVLLSQAHFGGGKGNPRLPLALLADHHAGIIALSAGECGELARTLRADGENAAVQVAHRYRDLFGPDNYYVELQNHLRPEDGPRNASLAAVATRANLRCVATNNVHYATADRSLLHHVVTCIRHGMTLEQAGTRLRPNDEYHLKPPARLAWLMRDYPDALATTVEIARRCHFTLSDLSYEFPHPTLPTSETALSYLTRLVDEGRQRYYPNPPDSLDARIEQELAVVEQLHLAGYLLTFRDVVDFCHREGILVSIRGSAPSSVLLYCLGLCPIDPLEHNLLFERFASPERQEMPDIDLDIAHEDRERVIQYVYERYGRDHAAMVCEVNTYRLKSALRDIAKVLGFPPQQAQGLASAIAADERDGIAWLKAASQSIPDKQSRHPPPNPHPGEERSGATTEGRTHDQVTHTGSQSAIQGVPAVTADPNSGILIVATASSSHVPTNKAPPHTSAEPAMAVSPAIDAPIQGGMARLIVRLCRQLINAPRHLSIHVGGMVISSRPITDVLPIEPARMPGRTIIPWDKDDIATLAESFQVCLVKMDLLGLGMLTLIRRVFVDVRERTGVELRLHGFTYDERVFDVLCKGDTVGLFQIESRAQMSFLPRMRPRNLRDTAICVGAIRPGPGACQAGSHIARRRAGREPVVYPHHSLIPVLRETYGVVLWQEQVMQVAMTVAGYTGGQADQLRRAMSNKRSYDRMASASQDLCQRMVERGHSPEFAQELSKMVMGFAGYGFPRAHAYPFAHLALISATLKLRYPATYYAALINSQPMGFYSPHTIIWDARRHDVRFLPIDVNRSSWECTIDGNDVRLGFKEVKGLGRHARDTIEAARSTGEFHSIADFVRRTGLDRDALEALAEVGAFLGLPHGYPDTGADSRRSALWTVGELAGLSSPRHLPGLAELLAESADLPPMSTWEETRADYHGMGFSPHRHVISYYRDRLAAQRAYPADELAKLPNRLVVRAGGLTIIRQRPETSKKHVFITLEDETGLINVIVRPDVYERFRRAVREPLLIVEGLLQQDSGVTQIIARHLWPLAPADVAAAVPAHNYH
jgi:error-prone DNA polymerase